MKVLVILYLLTNMIFQQSIVNINELNTSESLYEKVQLLEKRYPDIIEIVELGLSTDRRPIYVVVLTENPKLIHIDSQVYVDKMHFFIESGIHSRENPGPNIMLKIIETYAQDYYNDRVLPGYNMSSVLKKNVFHIIPLSNPDGYDLANSGLYTISQSKQKLLMTFDDQNFSKYKSNVHGVDLNRNFPGDYYDVAKKQWKNIFRMENTDYITYEPGAAYYHGPYAASEIETRYLMDYSLKYDFRNYLSFHSKGQVLFYKKFTLSPKNNEQNWILAKALSQATGYDLMDTKASNAGNGYLTDYTAMHTLKPSITVETIHYSEDLPVKASLVADAYEEVKLLPLIAVDTGQATGYFEYKWYQNGLYVRDFQEYVYAKAFQDKYGGTILKYQGKPRLYLLKEENKITRSEMVHQVMRYVPNEGVATPYLDCDDPVILNAKAKGIISAADYFRPYDYATYEEAYVVLCHAKYPEAVPDNVSVTIESTWAREALQVLIDHEILDESHIQVGRMTQSEFDELLKKVLE